ncbi:MG284/MPN403 family protein [Ureaplasma ceti]
MHDCNYEAIQDYLNIIDMACNNLTPENKEVINLIFVKRLKYNETFYSKSVYYEKKKRATREFIGILINDYNTEKVFADLVNNVKPFLY